MVEISTFLSAVTSVQCRLDIYLTKNSRHISSNIDPLSFWQQKNFYYISIFLSLLASHSINSFPYRLTLCWSDSHVGFHATLTWPTQRSNGRRRTVSCYRSSVRRVSASCIQCQLCYDNAIVSSSGAGSKGSSTTLACSSNPIGPENVKKFYCITFSCFVLKPQTGAFWIFPYGSNVFNI